jgi:hypothetical protein
MMPRERSSFRAGSWTRGRSDGAGWRRRLPPGYRDGSTSRLQTQAIDTVDARPQARGIGRALAFVVFSLFVVLLAPLLFVFGRMPLAAPVGVALILLTGLGIAVREDRPLTGTRVGLYWLGSAWSLGWSILMLVYEWGLGPRPSDRLVSLWWDRAFLASGAFVAGSALVLALVRRRTLEGTEIALYWLGTAVALTPAVSVLFKNAGWSFTGRPATASETSGIVAAVGLAAASALVLALVRGRALSTAELAIYGVGRAVGIVFVMNVTYWY